ncbi:MAG: 23S rRNA pseudouridine(1911/1915/1917) synthase RluD [Gammaproteobacteria bacterium]|nr:MAG: 23S rRNA pseudouridine(1911/1915/1917) synthase RluD [Gammaproteobacteria bacterium]RLA14839.1 MAG: 23S rRNA pseudouridine(1911/1915/1917) synthase RluD [Gammaproteobacteria bacterium]
MTESAELYQIPPEFSGLRLDQAVAKLLPEFSRNRLQRWIRDGQVRVNGEAAQPRQRLVGGEVVAIEPIAPTTVAVPAAQAIELDVIDEDADVIIINKPPGLVVHPGAGISDGTLQNGLLYRYPELADIPRAGIIHRLDKNTSGLMVVTRTLQAHKVLTDKLAEREISREYFALVHGWIISGGTVDAAIGRHPGDRTRMTVTEGGREARSHYRLARQWPHHTLLRVQLDTGRTHQIRVHMRHIRHPVVGDPTYGNRTGPPARSEEALQQALLQFKRQALHATRLAFDHPRTGLPVEWEQPVPTDFQQLIDALDHEYGEN